MWLPGGFPLTSAAVLLQNLSIALVISADKFLLYLGQRYRILNAVRFFLLNFILYLLAFISFFIKTFSSDHYTLTLPTKDNRVSVYGGGGGGTGEDSAIARSLSQILSIVTDIPVTSRKYEVVQSMAERIIEDNQQEGNQLLHEVNRSVLSSAFKRTLSRLEAAVAGSGEWGWKTGNGLGDWPLSRVTAVVHCSLRQGWGTNRWDLISAEKLAAELLWLAQKLVACGSGDEAVRQWAAASNLSWLALTAEPQLQGSLLKVAAFLIKEAKGMRSEATMEAMNTKPCKVTTKLKMLQTWLPFLCRAGNGTDTPVLSGSQRSELQKVLEESIEELEDEQEREHVLLLWLHHFTLHSSSDWPNLHGCYARWCSASRRQLILLQENKKERQLMLLQENTKKNKKESDEIIMCESFSY
ncbi:hypothetical protein QN277_019978 [Acacia crassicarpa]|uniref:Uncharacterized protein n=1 Tax=Acacia crassicarpa TaxID=499986 RepID=A0AAE1JLZ5_9FABA|nr:hypothetical protein QN277_019978 [Acacia crassicarpa]